MLFCGCYFFILFTDLTTTAIPLHKQMPPGKKLKYQLINQNSDWLKHKLQANLKKNPLVAKNKVKYLLIILLQNTLSTYPFYYSQGCWKFREIGILGEIRFLLMLKGNEALEKKIFFSTPRQGNMERKSKFKKKN